jgi:hypothetical protein
MPFRVGVAARNRFFAFGIALSAHDLFEVAFLFESRWNPPYFT